MSVQTQINRIKGLVDDQIDLMTQIKAALDGKAAGGGVAVESGTLTGEYVEDRFASYYKYDMSVFANKALVVFSRQTSEYRENEVAVFTRTNTDGAFEIVASAMEHTLGMLSINGNVVKAMYSHMDYWAV